MPCQGIAASTKAPCRRPESAVGVDGYCDKHRPGGQMCVIPKKDGTQCKSRKPFDEQGRCTFVHRGYALPGEPQCEGVTTTNEPCRREPQSGRRYCSLQHEPDNNLPNPNEFGLDRLRYDREDVVAARDKHKDYYTGAPVVVKDRKTFELDHVCEKQAIAGIYLFAVAREDASDKIQDWAKALLTDIINSDENLGLTTKKINGAKGKAFKGFLDKYLLEVTPQPGLRECLLDHTATSDANVMDAIMDRMQEACAFVKSRLDNKKATLTKRSSSKLEVVKDLTHELVRMATAMGIDLEPLDAHEATAAVVAAPSSPRPKKAASRGPPSISPPTKETATRRSSTKAA